MVYTKINRSFILEPYLFMIESVILIEREYIIGLSSEVLWDLILLEKMRACRILKLLSKFFYVLIFS